MQFYILFMMNKANLTDLKAAILLKLDSNNRFVGQCDLEIRWMTQKTIGHLDTTSSFVYHFKAMGEFELELQSGNGQLGSKSANFIPCNQENLRMTLKNNRTPLRCYFKLFPPFHSHRWIQTGVIVRKRPIEGQNWCFLSRVNLKFHKWPWKTIGHLVYAIFSFVHHFIAISEIKLNFECGYAKIVSKSMVFHPCDLEIWQVTLKTIGHLFDCTSSCQHPFIAISETKLELLSSNAQFRSTSMIFFISWICNNSWIFHDDALIRTWWKRCDGRKGKRTDGRTGPS